MKNFLRQALKVILVLTLVAFLILAAGFFAVRFGLTNVAGEENTDSFEYNLEAKKDAVIIVTENVKLPVIESIYGPHEKTNRCKIEVATRYNDYVSAAILKTYLDTKSEVLLDKMLLAMKLRLPARQQFGEEIANCEITPGNPPALDQLSMSLASTTSPNLYTWQNGEPWQIIREAIIKDQKSINDAALASGVQPRLLLSVAIVEQLRLYYTQRELFEKFFKPLKILATANKMAWGVMSIKEDMAISTENNLVNPNSDFYPGDQYRNLLDFPPGADIKMERYNRLTDSHNHYYSYLYGALIIKEIQSQWLKHGYSLEYRPEIVSTLFNIGFSHSLPKDDPLVGGSTLDIGGEKYFFGSLAYEFYYSGELATEFPFK